MVLSCIISEIKRYIGGKSRFFIPPAFCAAVGVLVGIFHNVWHTRRNARIMVWLHGGEKNDDMFSRFDTIPACERQTDWHTNRPTDILQWHHNNNNSKTMFMVLSPWQSHCESSPGSFDECRTAPSGRWPKTKPDNLGCESACTCCQIYTHHRHLLLLLSLKADTHFTVPRRVEGWVDLAGWLHTEMVYPSTDGHPSEY